MHRLRTVRRAGAEHVTACDGCRMCKAYRSALVFILACTNCTLRLRNQPSEHSSKKKEQKKIKSTREKMQTWIFIDKENIQLAELIPFMRIINASSNSPKRLCADGPSQASQPTAIYSGLCTTTVHGRPQPLKGQSQRFPNPRDDGPFLFFTASIDFSSGR